MTQPTIGNTNVTDCPTCKARANKPCRYVNRLPGTRPKAPRGIRATMHKSRRDKLTRLLGTLEQAGVVRRGLDLA